MLVLMSTNDETISPLTTRPMMVSVLTIPRTIIGKGGPQVPADASNSTYTMAGYERYGLEMPSNVSSVLHAVLSDYALFPGGIYGVVHWARVFENGVRPRKGCEQADQLARHGGHGQCDGPFDFPWVTDKQNPLEAARFF